MAERIDKRNLGVDAHKLGGTSIEFLDENSSFLKSLDEFIIEGEEGQINIVKDNGSLRPHLVLNLRELHSKVALYMTSSATDEKMAVSNAIRGMHLFRSPYWLYSYINSSTVRGVSADKFSAIDRDKMMFVTEDCLLDMDSRAQSVNQLDLSITQHMGNAKSVEDLLKNDLNEEVFSQMIRSGKFELWYYERHNHNVHLYNPSANYIKLFLNAVIAFDNEKKNLPPEVLEIMAEVGGLSAEAYQKYVNYARKVEQLREKDERLHQVYRNARLYSQVLSQRGLLKLKQNLEGQGEYASLYGDPIDFSNLSAKDRLQVELNRVQLRGKKRAEALSLLSDLLKEEERVVNSLRGAVSEILDFLEEADEYERLDLSKFPYKEVFWSAFYDHSKVDAYAGLLANDLAVKYARLSREYNNHRAKLNRERVIKTAETKKLQAEADHRLKEYEARVQTGVNTLVDRYLELYGRAFRLYSKGKLTLENSAYQVLFGDVRYPDYKKIEFGKETVKKLVQELKAQDKMRPAFISLMQIGTDATNRLRALESDESHKKLIEVMAEAVNFEDKIDRTNKSKPENQRKQELKKAMVESFKNREDGFFDEDQVEVLIDPEFNYGRNSEEVLTSMQDIMSAKTTLQGQAGLRANKLAVLQAVVDLNSPELLDAYQEARTAIDELIEDGFVLPPNITIKNLDQIGSEVDLIIKNLSGRALTKDVYIKLLQEVESKKSTIKNFIFQTAKLKDARQQYLQHLDVYNKKLEKERQEVAVIVPTGIATFDEQVKKDFSDPESSGFQKNDEGKWVQLDLNNNEIGELNEDVVMEAFKTYVETNKSSLDPRNYSNEKIDSILLNEAFNKVFPPAEILLAETRKSMKSATSLDEVIKRYKKAEKQLSSLATEEDLNKFKEYACTIYGETLLRTENLLKCTNCFIYNFERMVDDQFVVMAKREADEEDGEAEFLIAETIKIKDKRVKLEFENHHQMLSDLRERVGEIISAMPYRTTETVEEHITKSSVKNATQNGIKLAKSLAGENGIVQYLNALSERRDLRLGIFTKLVEIESYRNEASILEDDNDGLLENAEAIKSKLEELSNDPDVNKQVSKDDPIAKRLAELKEEIMENQELILDIAKQSMEIKSAIQKAQEELDKFASRPEQDRVMQETFEYVLKEMNPIIEKIQKPIMDKMKLDIVETARIWMAEDKAHQEFVENKDQLPRTLKKNIDAKVKKIIWCRLCKHDDYRREGYDYISFYPTVYHNLEKIKKAFHSNTPIEGGEFNKDFAVVLDTIFEVWHKINGTKGLRYGSGQTRRDSVEVKADASKYLEKPRPEIPSIIKSGLTEAQLDANWILAQQIVESMEESGVAPSDLKSLLEAMLGDDD